MNKAIEQNDEITWKKLLLLPIILHSNTISSLSNKEQKDRIKSNLSFLFQDNWNDFTFEFFLSSSSRRRKNTSRTEENREKDILRYIKSGEISKAVKLMNSSLTTIPHDNSTLQKLSTKYPPKYIDDDELSEELWEQVLNYNINDDPNAVCITTTVSQLEKIIESKKRLITPGYDLLRYEHIKALFATGSTTVTDGINGYRESLTQIINMIILGKLPEGAATFLRGIKLNAQPKKDSAEDIRPIGLQVLYRKLAASAINTNPSFKDFNTNHFKNTQYCLDRNGSEKIIHCLQTIIDASPSLDIFTPDASNAYNCLNIKHTLNEVKVNFPSILPFIRQTYGTSSDAWYELTPTTDPDSHRVAGIHKEEGVDQGCSSASFLYSIGIQPLLKEISTCIENQGFVKYFVDDGNIAAPTNKMIDAINILSSKGPSLGYSMNKAKGRYLIGKCASLEEAIEKKRILISLNFIPSESIIIHPDNLNENNILYGTIALGSPVGTKSFILKSLEHKINELNTEADNIMKINDPQAKHLILKYSFSQKITYLLRTINPSYVKHFIHDFTALKRKIFTSIKGHSVDDVTWTQCSLPTSLTGLGYGDCTLTSITANIASTFDSKHEINNLVELGLVDLNKIKKFPRCFSSLSKFNELTNPNPTPNNPTINTWTELENAKTGKSLQSSLMSKFKQYSIDHYINILTQSLPNDQQTLRKKIVHFRSLLDGDLSSQCFERCPTSDDFTFTPEQFRIILSRRLMIPVHTYTPGTKCPCGKNMDEYGSHISSRCNKDSSLFNIHNSVLRTIDNACRSQGLFSILELTHSNLNQPDNEKRPDLTVSNWPNGNPNKVIDLAIVDCVSHTVNYRNTEASLNPNVLLKKRENQKISKYRNLVERNGGQFEPLVISTSGRITANTRKLLDVICQKPLGDNARIRSNRTRHQYWLSRISFTLSKTIANEIIIRSAKVNGRQYDQNSTSSANNSFPDSLDIHLEMSR